MLISLMCNKVDTGLMSGWVAVVLCLVFRNSKHAAPALDLNNNQKYFALTKT